MNPRHLDMVRKRWRRRCHAINRPMIDYTLEPNGDYIGIREGGFLVAGYVVDGDRVRYAGKPVGSIESALRSHFLWGYTDAMISAYDRVYNPNVKDRVTVCWYRNARVELPRRFRDFRIHVRENVEEVIQQSFGPSTIPTTPPTINVEFFCSNLVTKKGIATLGDGSETMWFVYRPSRTNPGVQAGQYGYYLEARGAFFSHYLFRILPILPSARALSEGIVINETDFIHLKLAME